MARCVSLRRTLEAVAREAIAACEGGRLVEQALAGASPPEALWAAGKAAEAMARGALAALGEVPAGLVIGKDAPGRVPLAHPTLEERVAGHPVPDARSEAAACALEAAARRLSPDGRALLLLSGGASALLSAPLPPVTLEALRKTTRALVEGGARIDEINVVRRHLGRVLGGRLAQAAAGAIDVLALSDVIGDDPAAIGSGPASPDPSTLAEARALAARYGAPASVVHALGGALPETPKPGDACFERTSYRVLANPLTLRDAAAAAARSHGLEPVVRARPVTGEVADFASEVTAVAASLSPGRVFVAAGEPTVVVRGPGRGGRAQHLALLVAERIAGRALAFLAVGSDGSDGPTDAAGAAVDGDSWHRDARAARDAFDAHGWLSSRGLTIATGPTGTNLTDLFLLARAA